MLPVISNTSPLVYLHLIGLLDWLPQLFAEIFIPSAVVHELHTGQKCGYNVPDPHTHLWLKIVDPAYIPWEWFALDLGPGELAAMSLALEHPTQIILLDDMLARRTAQAAGLTVWGTLKVILEGKSQGLTSQIAPLIDRLSNVGMWISDDVRRRILALADE